MTLRIIAGSRRGAVLTTPSGGSTRPTLGRVRESLFMILMPQLPGARVLDVFAGCGSLGLESLSRGAARAVFVENAPVAQTALRANLKKLDLGQVSTLVPRDALACLAGSASAIGGPFDLILLDPPYGQGLADQALTLLAVAPDRWLTPEGILAVQVGRRDPLAESYGPFTCYRRQPYGETLVAFYAFSS